MCVLYCMYLPAVFVGFFVIEGVRELNRHKRAKAPIEDELKTNMIQN